MVEAIHCTVAPVQACEASAQSACCLGTAATGSPGLMTGQGFNAAPLWPLLQGNWEQALLHLCLEELSLVPRMSFNPTPSSFPCHNQASDP